MMLLPSADNDVCGIEGTTYGNVTFYLNDVEEGGETGFRELNLKVQPVKGRAVHFANVYAGTTKKHFEKFHHWIASDKGQKYIANFWLRQFPF